MSRTINKHGLSRDIPAPTARAVRQECGFGCVICGCAIYQYEHIDPEWHNATSHAVSKIALLCGKCHDHVTRRFWSKESVKQARLNPFCKRHGYSRLRFEGADPRDYFTVRLGGCEFVRPRHVLRILGHELLSVREPEAVGAPVRVTARIYDRNGHPAVEIIDNEYHGRIDNWDIETGRGRILVRSAPHHVTLDLRILGPSHLAIRRLQMSYTEIGINASDKEVELTCYESKLRFSGSIIEPECAIDIVPRLAESA